MRRYIKYRRKCKRVGIKQPFNFIDYHLNKIFAEQGYLI